MAKWRITLWVAIVVATLAFLYAVRSILLPFVLAWVIAVLLEPVVKTFRDRGIGRGPAVILITLAFFLFVAGATMYAAPRITNQLGEVRVAIQRLTDNLVEDNVNDNYFLRWNPVVKAQPPGALGWVDKTLEDTRPILQRFGLPTTRQAIVDQYIEPHRNEIAGIVQNFFNGFLGLIGGAASQFLFLLFTPLFVYMMLMDMEQIRRRSVSWIPPMIRSDTLSMLTDIGDVFKKYLRGVMITIGTYTALMIVLLATLGAPYSILIALLAGALYLVPFLGAWISTATLFVIVGFSGQTGNWFLQFESPWIFSLVVSGIFIAVSAVFDQLVYPRLVGRAVDLHPLVSMFVIFSGGALFGLPGMIISFPLAGAIKVTLSRLTKLTHAPHEDFRLPAIPLRHRQAS